MATVFGNGTRDSLPLKVDTVTGISRVMVTNVNAAGVDTGSGGGGGGTVDQGASGDSGDPWFITGTVSISGTVAIAEPVSIDDNGGSLTVDGTVAVSSIGSAVTVDDGGGSITVDGTVSVTGSVTVAEPVSVDDNGGSLTVDTPQLPAALGLFGGLTVEGFAFMTPLVVTDGGTPIAVSDGGGSITVDGTVAVTQPVAVTDNSGSLTIDTPQLATTLGQKTMANSASVVIASDQTQLTVFVNSLPLPPGASTLAEQQTQTASLSVMDDWDESDRAKVNIIVGQAGITAGAGAVAANTPRVTMASDSPDVASLSVIDDWDETDRCKVNPIVGQAGVQGASGTVSANTQRVVLATDVGLPAGTANIGGVNVLTVPADPFGLNADAASATGSISAKLRLLAGALIADNAPAPLNTGLLFPMGYVLDETAGSVLAENDQAMARIDDKRAQVIVIEDRTTRGRKLLINADGSTSGSLNGTINVIQSALPVDGSAAFVQESSLIQPVGYVLDDTVGVALVENDVACPRIDSKRATIATIEDATTRGQRVAVSSAGALSTSEANAITDNAAFTDGTSKVMPVGFILDETAGTALTENDAAAARVDSKRAQVMVLEDQITRGQRASVTSAGALSVSVNMNYGLMFADHTVLTTSATVDMSQRPCKHWSLQAAGVSGTPTVWTAELQVSNDSVNFFTILTHTTADGLGKMIFTATIPAQPALYARVRTVTTLTLSGATALRIVAIGVP